MKKIVLLVLILIICGCEKKVTKTIIESNENFFISINYPITHIKKIDKKIEKYVNNYYDDFNKDSEKLNELNISYTYDNILNRYLSITIDVYKYEDFTINDSLIINYDTLNNKFIDDIPIHEVKVNNEIKINKNESIINPNSKVIALTFDDGPSYYTKSILKILDKYNIKATFFVIGNKVKTYSECLKEMVMNGHEIGNHTYSHKLLSRLSIDEYLSEINKTQELLDEYVGYTPTLFRPSYGSISKKFKSLSDLDIILWNIDTLDWKYNSYKKIAKRAISKAKDMGIILMHDTYKRSYKALDIIINELLNDGYQFVTINEMEKIKLLRDQKGNI